MQSLLRTFRLLTLRTALRVDTTRQLASASSVHDPRQVNIPDKEELTQEEMDKIQNNPYFNKYSKKLKNLEELVQR